MPEAAAKEELTIRPARVEDFDALWPILRGVIRAGDTYSLDPDMNRDATFDYWMKTPRATYVAILNGVPVGTYYIRTNQKGGGAHVCNCGYIVDPRSRGHGIARKMCEHSQVEARALGYRAMQFNFVVSTNTGAIGLWQSLGFDTVGRLPRAFDHPRQGLTDALVMYKWLNGDP